MGGNSTKSVVSLVLGIVGIIIAIFIPIAGLVLGIVATVFASGDRKIEKNGMNTAGLALGIISIVLAVIMWIMYALVIATFMSLM